MVNVNIPSITFMTDNGVEVKRYYNKYTDCFGGNPYRDVYDSDLTASDLRQVERLMNDKPKTYDEYIKYIQSNICEQ